MGQRMANTAKAKGSQFERDCVAVFNANGHPHAERRYGAGAQADKGDLQGFKMPRGGRGVVIECKNVAKITLSTILAETAVERANAGADLGVAIIKRRGRSAEHAYAVMTLAELAVLLKAAGY